MKTFLILPLVLILAACSSNNPGSTEKPEGSNDHFVEVSDQTIDNITVTPETFEFTSSSLVITLKNSTTAVINLTTLLDDTEPAFSIKTNRCGSSLAKNGGNCQVTLQFSSRGLYDGDYRSVFTINSTPIQLLAHVTGQPDPNTSGTANISLTLNTPFDPLNGNPTRTLTIKNIGNGTAKNVLLDVPTEYVISVNRCPSNLSPTKSCTVQIYYKDYRSGNPAPSVSVKAKADNVIATELGLKDNKIIPAGPVLYISKITAGFNHVCLLKSSGIVSCVGGNNAGQLGTNSVSSSTTALSINSNLFGNKTVASINANGDQSCLVTTDGKSYCWGWNQQGNLGNGITAEYSQIPSLVGDVDFQSKTIVQTAQGYANSCWVDSEGLVYCAGYLFGNGNIQNGGTKIPKLIDFSGVLLGKKIVQISSYNSHTCALDTVGKAYCWGDANAGQLGSGGGSSFSPVAVNTTGVLSGVTLKRISTGQASTCAIDSDGKLYCWGKGQSGRLGNGSTSDSSVPVKVDMSGDLLNKKVVDVVVGENHACALDKDGYVYCWGDSYNGQLGNGVVGTFGEYSAVPHKVPGLSNIKDITVGELFTCVLDTNSKVYCWGRSYPKFIGPDDKNPSPLEVVL